MNGRVKSFSDIQGYGFIIGDDNVEYFVHYSMINTPGYKTLQEAAEVVFRPVLSPKGPQAWDVAPRPVGLAQNRSPGPSLKLKPNPFTPQDPIIDPKKFAGRADVLANAIDCIFNNKNILITGARGIGKSSVAYQLANLTRGDRTLIDRIGMDTSGFEFNHMTGDHRCLPGNTLQTIVKGLLGTIVGRYDLRRKAEKVVTKWECDFKLFKASQETHEVPLAFNDELAAEFATATEDIIAKVDTAITGVCYLVDEIDTLDSNLPLANLLKAVTEKLRMDGYGNVSFILSGVTGTTTELIAQHPSAERLSETFSLDPMNTAELSEIIDNCLFDTGVTVTDSAKDEIIQLAAKFPAPVHFLGYHSFRLDSDKIIDIHDVRKARDFIIQNIKKQDFEGRLDRISSGLPLRVLNCFATATADKLTATEIGKLVNAPSDKVGAVLGDKLQLGNFVTRRGNIYEISEPLFKIYLKWISTADKAKG